MISINNVYKKFKQGDVLRGVSLDIKLGSIVGLAGLSGGGKSTLLRCIAGLEKIDAGSITCTESVGYMFQDFQLFPHMNVLQNITYAPLLLIKNNDCVLQAKDMLKALGIAHRMEAYPHQLSGGEKQRVALARSLMMKPQVLLCDEPTSGLDNATIQDVIVLLKSVRDMGVTIVIASHDMDFLDKIADLIVVLRDGKIA